MVYRTSMLGCFCHVLSVCVDAKFGQTGSVPIRDLFIDRLFPFSDPFVRAYMGGYKWTGSG
eukprot:600598-Lingulodinium_polyedra.AAC.1